MRRRLLRGLRDPAGVGRLLRPLRRGAARRPPDLEIGPVRALLTDLRVCPWKTCPGGLRTCHSHALVQREARGGMSCSRAMAVNVVPGDPIGDVPSVPMNLSLTGNRSVQPAQRPLVVREAQRALRDLGYDPGPIDGTCGSRMRAAL